MQCIHLSHVLLVGVFVFIFTFLLKAIIAFKEIEDYYIIILLNVYYYDKYDGM